MPRSNTGPGGRTLTGGRALYTGKNAYASQGFENDTRQSQLGGLVVAYMYGDFALSASTDNTVTFPVYASKLYKSPFTRRFLLLPDNKTFSCRASGTYRATLNVTITNLPTTNLLTSYINIGRGIDQIKLLANTENGAAGAVRVFQSRTWIVDLFSGDLVSLVVNAGAGAITLRGATTGTSAAGGVLENLESTSLIIEEIDLPAPA